MNELIKDYGNGTQLYKPFNSYDMNYHLIINGTDGLIDIDDILIYLDENDIDNIVNVCFQDIIDLIWKKV